MKNGKRNALFFSIILLLCCLFFASCELLEENPNATTRTAEHEASTAPNTTVTPSPTEPAKSDTLSTPESTAKVPAQTTSPTTNCKHSVTRQAEENRIDSTCLKDGSYEVVTYCMSCNEELKRQSHTIGRKKEHTLGKAVTENYVDSTTESEGSYDVVVYCDSCGEQLSRKTIVIDRKPQESWPQPDPNHQWQLFTRNDGVRELRCIDCDMLYYDPSASGCTESHELTVEIEPTHTTVGIMSVQCESCGYGKVEVIQPTNTGAYFCDMTLQEYADASAVELRRLAALIYEECEATNTAALYRIPHADLATYAQIKAFTLELTKNATTDREKAQLIYNWICENIIYDTSYNVNTPAQVWETRRGACSQYVQLMHDMLSSVGILSSYVSVFTSEIEWDQNTSITLPTVFNHLYETGHAVVSFYADGEVLLADPTWGAVLKEASYFDMSNETFSAYCIAVELDWTKIVPEGVDVRNYMVDAIYRIGNHLLILSQGEFSDTGAIFGVNNNLQYVFTRLVPFNNTGHSYFIEISPQPQNAILRNCVTIVNGDLYFHLPNGLRVSYSRLASYALFENSTYGAEISLAFLENYALQNDSLYRLKEGSYRLEACWYQGDTLTIPREINGIPVTEISELCFQKNQTLKRLTVEAAITQLSPIAFFASAIEELYLPASVEQLSFTTSKLLRVLVVSPDNPYYTTAENVLYNKDMTELLYYPGGKTDRVFSVPEGVKKIERISNNAHLEQLILPEGLTEIGELITLENLSQIHLPSTLRQVHSIFGNSLSELVFPDGVTHIAGQLVSMPKLTRLVLPASLEELQTYASLFDLDLLEEFYISPSNQHFATVNGVLFTKDMKTLIAYPNGKERTVYTVPDGVETINRNAFLCNDRLTEVILPESLKKLDFDSFNTASIERIDLKNVEELDEGVFAGCHQLKSLVLPNTLKKIGAQSFYDCGLEYVVIENPDLEASGAFFNAAQIVIFLTYDTLTDKEAEWATHVAAVYPQSAWQYVNGVPTPIE